MGSISTLIASEAARSTPSSEAVRLYPVVEAAKVLGVSRGFVYKLINDGVLRAVELGTNCKSKTRVRADDLQAFIDLRTHGEAGAA